MTPYLIIFDLDGTLVNTISDLAAACNFALSSCGYQTFPVADYPGMVGNGIYRLMSRALKAQGVDADPDGREVAQMTPFFKDYYNQHLIDHSSPYSGIPELLADLQARGVLLAVASNKYQAATERIVKSLFPDIRFAAVLGQRDGVPKKPDRRIVDDIARQANIPLNKVLYIGDSSVDAQTAQNAGVAYRLVDWGFERHDSDTMIVHSPKEIAVAQI